MRDDARKASMSNRDIKTYCQWFNWWQNKQTNDCTTGCTHKSMVCTLNPKVQRRKQIKGNHSSPFILNIVIVYIFISSAYSFKYLHDNLTGALSTYFITHINTCKFLKGKWGWIVTQWCRTGRTDIQRKMELSVPLYEHPTCDYCPQRLACQQSNTAARRKQAMLYSCKTHLGGEIWLPAMPGGEANSAFPPYIIANQDLSS